MALGRTSSVWDGHSCPSPLTLVLKVGLPLRLILILRVWDGHSCTSPLGLFLKLGLALDGPPISRKQKRETINFRVMQQTGTTLVAAILASGITSAAVAESRD